MMTKYTVYLEDSTMWVSPLIEAESSEDAIRQAQGLANRRGGLAQHFNMIDSGEQEWTASITETDDEPEIDAETLAAIVEAEADLAAGRVTPWKGGLNDHDLPTLRPLRVHDLVAWDVRRGGQDPSGLLPRTILSPLAWQLSPRG